MTTSSWLRVRPKLPRSTLTTFLLPEGGSKKRKAVENIDDTKVKKLKTEILANDEVWDLNESKISAPITLMSVEVIDTIFKKLDYRSLASSSLVCKQWLVLATEDDLWQSKS